MSQMSIDDYTLHYTARITDPDHPTLLFIHNLVMDSTEWEGMLDRLDTSGQEINWVTYDSSGYGNSGAGSAPLTLDHLIKEALALIDHLGIRKVHLVGSGMGGNIGLECARRYPDRLTSLTMMSPALVFRAPVYRRLMNLHFCLAKIDRNLLMKKLLADSFYLPTPEKEARFSRAFMKIPGDVLKEKIEIISDHPAIFHLSDMAGQISVPTLLMYGNHDTVFPPRLAAFSSACIPNCRWLIVPEAAHILPVDQPQLTAQFLLTFLRSKNEPLTSLPVYHQLSSHFRDVLLSSLKSAGTPQHRLQMHVMHEFSVEWNGRPIDGKWNQRGAKELLLFLIMHEGTATRETLIEHLMPDPPRARARNHLRVRINHLNQIFRDFPDPELQNILMIGEDRLSLNAETGCDIDEFLTRLKKFPDRQQTLKEQARALIRMLKQYDPAQFSSFKGDWIFTLTDQIENKLSDALRKLLPRLKAQHLYRLIREILQYGRLIEPYDGFCDEQLTEITEDHLI